MLDGTARVAGRLLDIVRVVQWLIAAYEMRGSGIAQSLHRMAGDTRTNIRLLITERECKNAVKMVIPAFLAIIALTIILVAPGAVRILNVLSGGL